MSSTTEPKEEGELTEDSFKDVQQEDCQSVEIGTEKTTTQLPKGVHEIQSYLIMLVAAMVQLEKRRKKRSYEDYLAADDDGPKHPFCF